MFSHTVIFAALAGLTMAFEYNPIVPVPASPVRRLMPRQTDAADPEETTMSPYDKYFGDGADDFNKCIDAMLDAAAGAPMPPYDILEWMTESYYVTKTAAYVEPTDSCLEWVPDIPGELVDDWAEYQKEVISWYSAHSDDVNKALSSCPTGYSSSVGPCTQTPTAAPVQGSKSSSGSASGPIAKGSNVWVAAAGAGFAAVVGVAAML